VHLTIEQLIQAAIGLLGLGATWGVMRASVRGVEKRLEQHMQTTSDWRESLDQRVQDLTNIAMGRK
jgi:hypothetical protein